MVRKKIISTYRYAWDADGETVQGTAKTLQVFNLDQETGMKLVKCGDCGSVVPVSLYCRVCGCYMWK